MFDSMFRNVDFYTKSLDGLMVRKDLNLQNIANQNTPKYKRKTVSFEKQLEDAVSRRGSSLRTTHEKHLRKREERSAMMVLTDRSGAYRPDGNNVDIDVENLELWKTYMTYNAVSGLVSGEFDKYKSILQEGGR